MGIKAMSRRALIFASILLVAGMVAAFYLAGPDWDSGPHRFDVSDQELADQTAKLGRTNMPVPLVVEKLDLTKPVRLAIGGLGLADNEANGRLGDLVTADLTGAPGYVLVERPALDVVLRELNLNWSGFVRAGDAVRAGKLLKVDWFLLGTEATLNGTNSLVVRVVDARTGIMRDAGVFPEDKPTLALAQELAGFLQETRQNAATAKTRVYLAVGAFEDDSINNRLAGFPTQLRGYLTAAYRGSRVTLLERESVATLQREVQLDLAGLTDPETGHPPTAMQSAFWLVAGSYQTYETTNFQVELKLEVQRIFGRNKQITLRGLAGEPVEALIKTTIDEVMHDQAEMPVPGRLSEARAQMYIGKNLLPPGFSPQEVDLVYGFNNWDDYEPQLAARKQRKFVEAIRSFETVLLLEPTNRLAKMYLAACLQEGTIYRMDEARQYYRELIEEPVSDQWSVPAQKALLRTFRDADAPTRLRWFETACQQTTNAAAVTYYRLQAAAADQTITMQQEGGPKSAQLAEQQLLNFIQSGRNVMNGRLGSYSSSWGMYDYVYKSGMEPGAAARKLVDLLPKLSQSAPELAPYLQAAALTFQTDTNLPLVGEFQQSLADYIEHPDKVFKPEKYWEQIRWDVYRWCQEQTNAALAVTLLEGERRAGAEGLVNFDDQEKVKLGYAYMAERRWQDALGVFEGLGQKTVSAQGDGPWGHAFNPIFPARLADYCRKKLGRPVDLNPRTFSMGRPLMCLCSPSTFLADANGLWVGIGGQLLHLDFDLKTNLVINLPIDPSTPVTALCLTVTNVWIATAGEGLIAFDKSSQQCRHLTEADGLLLNYLTGLHADGDSLWIGYGGRTGGGLGRLDLTSQKLTTYMPSLTYNADSASVTTQPPPKEAIYNMITADDGELWLKAGSGLRSYDVKRNVWGSIPLGGLGDWAGCFSANSEWLVEGVGILQESIRIESPNPDPKATNRLLTINIIGTPRDYFRLDASAQTNGLHQRIILNGSEVAPIGGVAFQSLRNHQWHKLVDAEVLPGAPTALALDGARVWLGGAGYITGVDLNTGKIRKFAPITSSGVDSLQIGGGYLWAQFDWHLYRVPLSTLE